MDEAQKTLFGELPRFIGNPEQWVVWNEDHFDIFLDKNEGQNHCYSRIGWISRTGAVMLDKVFLDLDGDAPDDMTDTALVRNLRGDVAFREKVLGDVVDDVRSVAELCFEESIPVMGVYSGKGVHLHLLYEVRENPTDQLASNQDWLVDECDIDTFDPQVRGDTKRLCRVPNCRRYDEMINEATDLYTVPLSRSEMRDLTVDELMDWSHSPRQIKSPGGSRPPYMVREGYGIDDGSGHKMQVNQQPVGEGTDAELIEQHEEWVSDVLQMPCLAERIQTRNPSHTVRTHAAVVMMNAGLSNSDIMTVFRKMSWHDWDPDVTRYQLKKIRRKGVNSISCSSMIEKGLCVYGQDERSEECDLYGYSGGDCYF